jgi:hypothetical protein
MADNAIHQTFNIPLPLYNGRENLKILPRKKKCVRGRYDGMLLLLFEKKNASMIVARSDEI